MRNTLVKDDAMSVQLEAAPVPFLPVLTPVEQLRFGRWVLSTEAEAVAKVSRRLDNSFCQAVRLLFDCRGSVIVTGMGKAGLIGQKIAATLASTGTQAHALHPAEAVHGDLGRISADDVVLALSHSGETEEIVRLLPILHEMGVSVVAITAREDSTLAKGSRVTIALGPLQEACPLGLAPSTSTTALLAVGDALALVVSRMRNFQSHDFARFHPAGSLGRRLRRVDALMRSGDALRTANDWATVREIFVHLQRPGRRTGAIMLVDDDGRLSGLFTDSDLARLFEGRRDECLDRAIAEVMTHDPVTVSPGTLMEDAVRILTERKISELPVVDDDGRPVGILDITDCIGLLPLE
jgi:arabinose-5-phosphate isomerase